jgi:hypothetical protein
VPKPEKTKPEKTKPEKTVRQRDLRGAGWPKGVDRRGPVDADRAG